MELLIEFDQLTPNILTMLRQERNTELYNQYNTLHLKFEEYQKLYNQFIVNDDFGSRFIIGREFIDKYTSSHEREMAQTIALLEEKLRNSHGKIGGADHTHC